MDALNAGPPKEKTAVALPGNTTAFQNTQQPHGTSGTGQRASGGRDLKAISSRSTATEIQIKKLIELLRIAPRHTHELRKLGISHPAGRIQDLEARGFVIASDRVTTVDENGFAHRGVARYTLVAEPLPLDAKMGAPADTCQTEPKGRNPITPESLPSAQMEIEPAGSEATA